MDTQFDGNDGDAGEAVKIHPRQVSAERMEKFEGYIAEIFAAFGMDRDTLATRETPRRFIQALFDATEGYDGDPKLIKVFETECRGGPDCRLSQVVEGPIHFYSLCEHHGFPIFGRAYVGYIAHEHIVGLSKLTRLLRLYARRFTVQERLGQQVADTLDALLQPHGVAVYIEAHHLCMEMRGVREVAPLTRTTYWRGNYDGNSALRQEFLIACGLAR
jgi:GTP cyclohydrolase IA